MNVRGACTRRLKEEFSMSIRQLGNATNTPTEELDDWGTPKTIGEPKCHLKGIQLIENDDGSEGGIWECSPGKFTREIMQAEFTTFLTGRAIFHPENGDPIEIAAGDVLFFPENSKGTWEILETTRKAYLCYNPKER
jgi:uncharacterized cupin superfamily protein